MARRALNEFTAHYHVERIHQENGSKLIRPSPARMPDARPISGRRRFGGMLNYYERRAALALETSGCAEADD